LRAIARRELVAPGMAAEIVVILQDQDLRSAPGLLPDTGTPPRGR